MDIISPNFGLAFWLVVIFLILLFILRKYAWGPITDALVIREQKIEESIQRAEKALAEAKSIAADNDKARREGELEAQRIIREAREAADHLKQQELDRVRTQIGKMQEQASEEILREKQHAIQAVRSEVADLVIQATEKVLNESMDAGRQKKLVNAFIDELPSN